MLSKELKLYIVVNHGSDPIRRQNCNLPTNNRAWIASAMAGINWTVNQIIARIIMHWCTREMRDTLANERCGWEVRMSRENGIHNRILSWALQAGGYADQLMAYRNSQRKRLNRQYNMGDTSKWVKQHLCWLFFFSARLNIQTSTLCKPLTAKYSRQWKICC